MLKIATLVAISIIAGCTKSEANLFQADADLIRLEHLEYWTGLVEEYYDIEGSYPFQSELSSSDEIALVKIATQQQIQYLSSHGDKYDKRLDNNSSGYFREYSVKEFVVELESALGRKVDEMYDIQKVPLASPIGYNYFASQDGYLVWVTCTTCGTTQISTLLMDGNTPTINIVSSGMVGKVTKALTRADMLSHPTFLSWTSKPLHKADYVRSLVAENLRDSK